MNTNKQLKEKILSYLIYNPKCSFSELYDNNRDVPSNEFTYYLNKLIEEDIIQKDENKKYSLTIKGKHLESTLDGKTGKQRKKPFVALLMVIRKNGKYLIYHRLKEPYYNFYGIPGAKLDFGESILDGAERELLEETKLKGQGKIISIYNVKTYENQEALAHMTIFVVLFDNPDGNLIKEGAEGTYEFVSKNIFLNKKQKNILFPDTFITLENAENFNGIVSFYEMSIFISNNKFTDFKYTKVF